MNGMTSVWAAGKRTRCEYECIQCGTSKRTVTAFNALNKRNSDSIGLFVFDLDKMLELRFFAFPFGHSIASHANIRWVSGKKRDFVKRLVKLEPENFSQDVCLSERKAERLIEYFIRGIDRNSFSEWWTIPNQ